MQLSLSSVPADSGASSLLNGLPGASGPAADATTANPGMPGGFAQMLAGCGAPGSGAAVPPAVVPGAVNSNATNPGAVAVFNFADARMAPATAAVDPTVTAAALAVPTAPVPTGTVPTATPNAGEKSSPSSGPRPKDLTALGDLQALAALLAPMATPAPTPVVPPTGTAPAQPEAANIDSDVALANGGGWGATSALMTLRPTIAGSAEVARTTMTAPAEDTAFAPLAESASVPASFAADMKQRPLSAPNAPVPDPAAPAASQPGVPPMTATSAPVGAPPNAADAMPLPTDVAPVLEQARVLAQMQGTEKIAGTVPEGSRRGDRAGLKAEVKSFVPPERKGLARFDPGLGIDTAKPAATMPAGATLERKTSSDPVVPTTAPVSETRADSMLPAPVALTSTAHRAVEAALATADRFSARDQRAVTLQFSVGGSDLNVRVELRAGEVHTTFRTDSPELRAALSSEWQAVTNQSPADRPVRLAAPVFTSAQDSGGSFSGDGATRQHQQESSNAGTSYPGATPVRGSGRGSSNFAGASVAAAAAPRAAAANSVHLHTLA